MHDFASAELVEAVVTVTDLAIHFRQKIERAKLPQTPLHKSRFCDVAVGSFQIQPCCVRNTEEKGRFGQKATAKAKGTKQHLKKRGCEANPKTP